ncbi:hypothetical protein F7725_016168 [Dissostichus mawsoni]|uniref:Uncharacterized protein n=1 Tax=Dissostichus mawsoni TaxID=36200 RepID=A0A7J5Y422_DISMA|nr:hypothetical protein F7725_016168 [Dissostichus mawsoni]
MSFFPVPFSIPIPARLLLLSVSLRWSSALETCTTALCDPNVSNMTSQRKKLVCIKNSGAALNYSCAELRRECKQVHELNGIYDAPSIVCRARPDSLQIIRHLEAEEVDRPDITNTPVAIVSMVTEGTPSQVDLSPASTAILVEGDFVISNIPRMADSFALLFGLMYLLHLDYPKKLINTFTFIQKVLMGLDDGKPLKPCLLNLKMTCY